MEILELNLKHFGKFTDYKLPLHAGINVISGGNETGKTTLHAFIRAMFYGLARNRSRNMDEYQLREPWDNPAYFAGSMRILHDGRIYRIDRNFYRKDESVTIVCETDGLRIEDTQAALHAFTAGLSESDFDNTIFIRQAQPQTTAQLGEHIRDFLVNLEENGTASTDVSAAQEHLKKKRKQIAQERQEKLEQIEEEIQKNTRETEYLGKDLERLLERSSAGTSAGTGASAFERMDTTVRKPVLSDGERAAEEEEASLQEPAAEEKVSASQEPSAEENTESTVDESAQPALRTGRGRTAEENREPNDRTEEEDAYEDDEPGGVMLPVLVMLSFVAAGLSIACAVLTTDHRLRYILGAGGVLCMAVALSLLWRITHPVTRTERALKRAKRGEFLDRHLGFRDDPDDPEARADQIRRDRRMQDAVEKAKQLDREEEERREKNRRMLLEKTLRQQAEEDRINRAREVAQLVQKDQKDQGQASPEGPASPEGQASLERRDDAQALRRERAAGQSDLLSREIRSRREKIAALREELEKLYTRKAALSSYDRELQAVDLASSRIRELSGRIYHESGDQFLENVSTLLAGLTEGRYNQISLDDRMQVNISTPDHLLKIDQVSCGTMNQVYLALRLASAQLLTGDADLPVLLDETFAMYDDERLESALRYLVSAGRQVILFSCQKRELEILARIRAGSS